MEGNAFLSTTVIEVLLYRGFLHNAHAVERPKAPLPMISTDEGGSDEDVMVQNQLDTVGVCHTYTRTRTWHNFRPRCDGLRNSVEKPISRSAVRAGSGRHGIKMELGLAAWQRPCEAARREHSSRARLQLNIDINAYATACAPAASRWPSSRRYQSEYRRSLAWHRNPRRDHAWSTQGPDQAHQV